MLANYMLCQNPMFWSHPHIGWFSKETDQKVLEMTYNIKAYLDQNPENNII